MDNPLDGFWYTRKKAMPNFFRPVLIVVSVLVLGLLGLYFFYPRDSSDNGPQTQQVEEVPAEAVEVVPETSPTQNTNPFEDTYKNPFE